MLGVRAASRTLAGLHDKCQLGVDAVGILLALLLRGHFVGWRLRTGGLVVVADGIAVVAGKNIEFSARVVADCGAGLLATGQ